MNYKLLPILFLLIINLSCQATTKQAHETDVKREAKATQLISQPQPVWITDPFSLFPKSSFVTAVGTGNNYQESDDQARHEMAAQFRVKLKGLNIFVTSRVTESSGDKSVVFTHSDSSTGIRTEVNLQLDGVVIESRWTDNSRNIFYSIAVMKRAPVIKKLTGQIWEIQSSILELQKDGDRLESERNFAQAAKRFLKAAEERKKLDPLIEAYQFVKNDFTPYLLHSEILSSLKLEKKIERLMPDQKPKAWEEGILTLAQQLISRLDVNRHLKVEKVDFRDLRSKKRMPFSELVESDLRRHLGRIANVSVVVPKARKGGTQTRDLTLAQGGGQPAPSDSMNVEITGFYKEMSRKKSVRISASLIDSRSLSMGEGKVEIKSEDIDPEDLGLIKKTTPLPKTEAQQNKPEDVYKLTMEWLLALKQENPQFDFKMWTDKQEYKICVPQACDKVNIFVQSERSGYLYLFDIGTSGNLWMLFPNERMTKSNFIQAGKVIKIPDDYWGSPIWVHEPEGLERIKAILTPEPVNWGALDKTSGFKRLKRDNKIGLKDLSLNMEQLPEKYPDMGEATISFFIRKQGDQSIRGTRSVKTEPPKKPMDIIGTMGRE